ncbi:hypothetical protein GGS26DRAFT_583500 [Hypomontagnella submonticulosa]|nr:hypothetical protein GGS26DRAFT_583500 [Hypomontagnella submonticulosa]
MSAATAEYVAAKTADIRAKSTAAFELASSKNPDKLRAMLKVWFVPDFKPTFYDENDRYSRGVSGVSSLDEVGLLDPSYSSAVGEPGGQEGRYPIRLIDLDTKHLVDYPDIGSHGQYCILSHSWKGREVNYRYVLDAKFKAFNRALAAAQVDNPSSDVAPAYQNDIDIIKHQCSLDILEQEERIKSLTREGNIVSELGLNDDDNIVEELLSRRVDVQIVESGHDGRGGLQRAKNKVAAALVARDYEVMEDEVFKKFLGDIGLDDDKADEVITGDTGSQSTRDVADAEKVLAYEKQRQSEEAGKIQFFERHGHIREAVEELIGCLQRSKSMVKIEQAIERSKEIFDGNPFPKTEKRYLWIDSCCINRGDDGEYARSISAMGEWYKHAEFCLVHLDTKRGVPKDALDDWQALKSIILPPRPNITSYSEIITHKPEWSTRAWTLQELVMSKTTFYVNSSWELLSRPVEHLGPWYYLYPFVSLHTSLDTNNPYSLILGNEGVLMSLTQTLDNSGIQHEINNLDPSENSIYIAQKLIAILEVLDLRIPRDIDMDTARSRISQSVYIAVSSLMASGQEAVGGAKQLLDNILEILQPHLSGPQVYSQKELARHAINIILGSLVNLMEHPVLDDRDYIANFGNVPNLNLWQKGLIRSRFSTQKVMSLVCGRDATVMTDRAYCLMGMLGVRFPTFPAEGLTKALSRLLDEVVISSNDVSVFNWTGRQYGSPIRGRSLYPSSPEAYKFDKGEERKKKKDKKLTELLQIKRYEVMTDFLAISGMLVDAIMFVKDRQQKNVHLTWVKEILRVFKRTKFEYLRPHITNVGKILKYVEKAFDSKSGVKPQVMKSPSPSTSGPGTPTVEVKEAPSKESSTSDSPFGAFSSQIKPPSLSKNMPSFSAPKFGRKKTEPEAVLAKSSSPPLSSRGIGGFKAPSLKGFGRKESETSQSSSIPTRVEKRSQEADVASLPSTPGTPSLVASDSPQDSLSSQVLSYIGTIRTNDDGGEDANQNVTAEPELPPELAQLLSEVPVKEFSKPHVKSEEIDTMISPNPIIVKNSGIEGLFDIQRVVVSLAQPEKLRRQVRNAISPHQQITGWCIISTGFARVMVSFSCPKYILERELDIVQSVESEVLNGKDYEDNSNDSGDTSGDVPAPNNQGVLQVADKTWQRAIKMNLNNPSEPAKKEEDTGMEDPGFEKVKADGARVSRMIKFVQEANLTEIAGEWILARFSGVPGAKWFLCYLELGGSGRDLYGHRIATDEIDFHNASPEMGLMKFWEYYMMQKKYRLCSILQKLMESKDWGNFKTEIGQNIVKRVAKETGVSGQDDGFEADSDDEDAGKDLSDTLKDISGMALTMAGAGLIQQFYEWRAERLQKNLTADVLKKFPTHMQTAMESLDDNKDLMPSMFHSAKKVHMF